MEVEVLALLGIILIVIAIVLFAVAHIGVVGLIVGILLGVLLVAVDRGAFTGSRL
jgi:hypothetical protein